MPDLQSERPLSTRGLRWLVPFLGLSVLTLAAIGYRYDPSAYFRVMTILMLHPYPSPFIDAQQIPAVIDCWKHGVDVYVTAPCDPLHRTLAYSPLWLRATFLPRTWSYWMGLALDSAFFMSLALLPQPRRLIDLALIILATFSSMPVFALERANMDVVMFLLIIAGGWCWARSLRARLVGYSLFAFVGLLKFYPLVLFLLFLRERMVYFIGLCIAAFSLLAGFVWYYHGELQEMAKSLPSYPAFSFCFGYLQLPFGLGFALRWLLKDAGMHNASVMATLGSPLFTIELLIIFVVVAIATAFKLGNSARFKLAFAALTPSERGFLIVGAALIGGCFFVVQNDSYRGIYLLFVLPGLLALSATPAMPRVSAIFRGTALAIIFVMWGMTIQLVIAGLSGGSSDLIGGSAAAYIYWIIRELTWWWIVSVLLAFLVCFVGQSQAWRTLVGASSEVEPGNTNRNVVNPTLASHA